jgi:threonine dehydrogenase-like Zn-dependent dehydrogenase
VRALTLEGPGRAMVVQVTEASAPAGSVVVEIDWCGLTAGDYGSFRLGRPWAEGFGACWSGRIVQLGAGVDGHFVGERVIGPAAGVPGLAERIVVEASSLWRVPEGVDDRDAVLVGPAALVTDAVLQGQVRVGDRVLVFGAGLVGLLTVAVARLAGAGMVSVIEPDAGKWELACDLGADATFLDGEEALRGMGGRGVEEGVHVTFDATGSGHWVQAATRLTRIGGTIVIVGPDVPGSPRAAPPGPADRVPVVLECRTFSEDAVRRVFDLTANDRLKLAALRRSETISLAQVPAVLAGGDPLVPLPLVGVRL